MRYGLVVLWMLLGSITSAAAQVSVGIGIPGVSIGISLQSYPELVRVPGYPVYYAPRLTSNYFFYDGMYWIYQRDNSYASSWYNGPWGLFSRVAQRPGIRGNSRSKGRPSARSRHPGREASTEVRKAMGRRGNRSRATGRAMRELCSEMASALDEISSRSMSAANSRR